MTAGCWTRANYYTGGGTIYIPYVCFDGVFKNVADNYNTYRNRFDQRKVIDSPLSIDMILEDYDVSTGTGHLMVKLLNVSQASIAANLRLVATGDDTLYSPRHYYWVALDLFPSAAGIAVAIPPGSTFETTQQFDLPGGWRNKPCTLVAYVQDDATDEILQGALLHDVVLGVSGSVVGGDLVLTWPAISGAAWYWIYGADDEAYFTPGLMFPYPNRLMVVPSGTTSWSTPSGIGDPDHNYSYMVIAVDSSQLELTRSNRLGEFDFGTNVP
jgi:hypothetical protein